MTTVLHRLRLVHTDLKPENILLVSNEARLAGPRVSSHLAFEPRGGGGAELMSGVACRSEITGDPP